MGLSKEAIKTLSEFDWPEVRDVDIAFPTTLTNEDLLALAELERKHIRNGMDKFSEIFYRGGELPIDDEVKQENHWKWKAYRYFRSLIGSWGPKHEHKEVVCGMLLESFCSELRKPKSKIKS